MQKFHTIFEIELKDLFPVSNRMKLLFEKIVNGYIVRKFSILNG